jgi:hypothetical protein
MKNNNSNDICGYFDVDWAGSFNRKSTIGFYIFVGENLATWKSKKNKALWLDQAPKRNIESGRQPATPSRHGH